MGVDLGWRVIEKKGLSGPSLASLSFISRTLHDNLPQSFYVWGLILNVTSRIPPLTTHTLFWIWTGCLCASQLALGPRLCCPVILCRSVSPAPQNLHKGSTCVCIPDSPLHPEPGTVLECMEWMNEEKNAFRESQGAVCAAGGSQPMLLILLSCRLQFSLP